MFHHNQYHLVKMFLHNQFHGHRHHSARLLSGEQEQQWRGKRHLEAEVDFDFHLFPLQHQVCHVEIIYFQVESLAYSHIDEHARLLVVFVLSDQDQQCEEGEVGAA